MFMEINLRNVLQKCRNDQFFSKLGKFLKNHSSNLFFHIKVSYRITETVCCVTVNVFPTGPQKQLAFHTHVSHKTTETARFPHSCIPQDHRNNSLSTLKFPTRPQKQLAFHTQVSHKTTETTRFPHSSFPCPPQHFSGVKLCADSTKSFG